MKKKKSQPVYLGNVGLSFGDVINQIQNQPAEELTPEKQEKINGLLKELAKSQGPGDAFMMLTIPSKKN